MRDKANSPLQIFPDGGCLSQGHLASASRPSPGIRTLLLLWFTLTGMLAGTGCFSVPYNAALTLPEGTRSLADEFEETASYPQQESEFLTYAQIEALAMNPHPEGALQEKLTRFWETPIISNAAWDQGIRPNRPGNATLGDYLRIGSWNIQHSLQLERISHLLVSGAAYQEHMVAPISKKQEADYLRQRERMASADVLVLQEIDIGVTRSAYIDGPEVLAQSLGMNYAYAPQMLELGPVLQTLELARLGGLQMPEGQHPDSDRYRGVFGLLILSKYPIKFAECFPLQFQPYNWYENELAKYDAVEGFRKFGTKSMFHTEILREVKLGGRIFFRVDLEVPGLPNDTLTVVNVHLEIKAQPGERVRQMQEILDHIGEIENPVVLAGDFNSSRYDMSPTSLPRFTSRLSQNPNFWIFGGINLLSPAYSIYNTGRTMFNEVKNLHNPLAFHNPVAFPNTAAGLFFEIRDFRFQDGGRFDFRGEKERSINCRTAPLSNSNEKAFKGYRTTFAVKRPIGPFGRERLDWIFVKSGFHTDDADSYRLAPHFGETLSAFHEPMPESLSDHRPNVVDLPLQSPPGP